MKVIKVKVGDAEIANKPGKYEKGKINENLQLFHLLRLKDKILCQI